MTVADLIKSKTSSEILQAMISSLAAKKFPVTSWQEGDPARSLLEVDAEALADVSTAIPVIAKSGFLDDAEGDWLTLHAKQVYNIDRKPSIRCQRTVTMTVSASAGPYSSLAPGSVIVSDTTGDYRFSNVGLVNLATGSDTTVEVIAETGGFEFNSAAISVLNTSLPGVTVSITEDDSITVPGTDDESDPSLRQRCRDLWGQLGTGSPQPAYRTWALLASDEVTRAQVLAATGTGVVSIRLAGALGGVSSDAVDAVTDYITPKAPLCVTLDVASAVNRPISVTATLYGPAQYADAALAQAATNLGTLLGTVGIGTGNTVFRSAVIEALMLPDGVVNATTSFADTALSANEVATSGTFNLTWSATS